jgi:hypothetical protein
MTTNFKKGDPVEFPPARMQFGEIEEIYPDGTAKIAVWVLATEDVSIRRFEYVKVDDLIAVTK